MVSKLFFGNIDYIFLVVIILFSAHSFIKGFINEAISIIVLFLAAFLGYKFYTYLSYILQTYISLPTLLPVISFIISFFICYFCLTLIAQSITKRLQLSIGLTDRFLGLVFGGLKSFFIILLFYIVMDIIIPITNQPYFLTHSFFRELVLPIEKQLFYNLNHVNIKTLNS